MSSGFESSTLSSFSIFKVSVQQVLKKDDGFFLDLSVETINRRSIPRAHATLSPYSCGIHSAIIPDPGEPAELRQFRAPRRETRACHKERNVTVSVRRRWAMTPTARAVMSPRGRGRPDCQTPAVKSVNFGGGLIQTSPKSDWWKWKKERVVGNRCSKGKARWTFGSPSTCPVIDLWVHEDQAAMHK